MQKEVTMDHIKTAEKRLHGVVHHTPLDFSSTFSAMSGAEIYLKLENLQKTGSFKIRGAYNKVQSLSPKEREKGVIAASAGNHAQGVAYGAHQAGIESTIVMPEAAPLAKIVATRGYGADVVLCGEIYDEAFLKAQEIEKKTGKTYIHAFDDAAVIAGQGTIGLEILKDLPDVSAIVVPVGGGGLIAGIATAVKTLAPQVKIYGVQAEGAPSMQLSYWQHAKTVSNKAVTVADGIAVKEPGDLTFRIVEDFVDDIVTVDDEAIVKAILLMLERSKMMVEGAGAVSLAAVLQKKLPLYGKIVSVISGGNIDVNFISRIIERGLVKAGRRVSIAAAIDDRPGALQKLLTLIAAGKANVMQVSHDRVAKNVSLGQAAVEISLETRDAAHTDEILALLREHGYQVSVI